VFGSIAAFVSILLVEALCVTSTTFRDLYRSPVIVASFGASAVLVYGVIESPLSQPRNLIGGQIICAIIGVALTRLFARDHSYLPSLRNESFHGNVFVNGALSMSIALLAMFITGTVHPPGGATALIAATSYEAAAMSWKYIPVVICSTLVMFGWALIINNLGRRRYPIYWWSPQRTFVIDDAPEPPEDEEIALGTGRDNVLRQAEDGGRTAEAILEDRLSGRGGSPEAIMRALSRESRAGTPYSHRQRRKSIA
jgi:CBS-domain-containing membrane protein